MWTVFFCYGNIQQWPYIKRDLQKKGNAFQIKKNVFFSINSNYNPSQHKTLMNISDNASKKKSLNMTFKFFFRKIHLNSKKNVSLQCQLKKKQRTMKRQNHLSLLLFIVLIFNIVHDSYGQHRIVEVPFSDKITNVIVREYDFPSTVSYIETADSHLAARKARLSANKTRNL